MPYELISFKIQLKLIYSLKADCAYELICLTINTVKEKVTRVGSKSSLYQQKYQIPPGEEFS